MISFGHFWSSFRFGNFTRRNFPSLQYIKNDIRPFPTCTFSILGTFHWHPATRLFYKHWMWSAWRLILAIVLLSLSGIRVPQLQQVQALTHSLTALFQSLWAGWRSKEAQAGRKQVDSAPIYCYRMDGRADERHPTELPAAVRRVRPEHPQQQVADPDLAIATLRICTPAGRSCSSLSLVCKYNNCSVDRGWSRPWLVSAMPRLQDERICIGRCSHRKVAHRARFQSSHNVYVSVQIATKFESYWQQNNFLKFWVLCVFVLCCK